MDFDPVLQILRFNSQKQRSEPFQRAKVTHDPEEIHLPQSGLALWIVHPIPDALQDTRERCDTDTCTAKNSNLKLEDVFRSRSEGPIDINTGKNAAQSGIFVRILGNALNL